MQACQDVALAQEAFAQLGRGHVLVHELERHAMLELPIRAFGQIHPAHATGAEQLQ